MTSIAADPFEVVLDLLEEEEDHAFNQWINDRNFIVGEAGFPDKKTWKERWKRLKAGRNL